MRTTQSHITVLDIETVEHIPEGLDPLGPFGVWVFGELTRFSNEWTARRYLMDMQDCVGYDHVQLVRRTAGIA